MEEPLTTLQLAKAIDEQKKILDSAEKALALAHKDYEDRKNGLLVQLNGARKSLGDLTLRLVRAAEGDAKFARANSTISAKQTALPVSGTVESGAPKARGGWTRVSADDFVKFFGPVAATFNSGQDSKGRPIQTSIRQKWLDWAEQRGRMTQADFVAWARVSMPEVPEKKMKSWYQNLRHYLVTERRWLAGTKENPETRRRPEALDPAVADESAKSRFLAEIVQERETAQG